jgi:hypothetical protein
MKKEDTVEIRQRTKWVVMFLLTGVLLFMTTGCWIFFAEKYAHDLTARRGYIVGLGIFLYFAYSPVVKLLKNQPIITFAPDSIILNTSRKTVIGRDTIRYIDVVYEEGEGYFLNIKTAQEDHKVGLTWLNTTHVQIGDLIGRYKTAE